MAKPTTYPYTPDTVTPLGDTLLELLEEREMSLAEFAHQMGYERSVIDELLESQTPLTPQMATQIERVLGTPAQFWLNRDKRYQDYLAQLALIEEPMTIKKANRATVIAIQEAQTRYQLTTYKSVEELLDDMGIEPLDTDS